MKCPNCCGNLERCLGIPVTIRNLNTVNRLLEIAAATASRGPRGPEQPLDDFG